MGKKSRKLGGERVGGGAEPLLACGDSGGDGCQLLAGVGAHQVLRAEEAGKDEALRLIMASQELAVVVPIGGGSAGITQGFIDKDGLLERLSCVRYKSGVILSIGGMDQSETMQTGIFDSFSKLSSSLIAL